MDDTCWKYECAYSDQQAENIDKEFQRIEDYHFLDHGGGTLYSEKQIENVFNDFKKSLLCNPHGKNCPSQKTGDSIDIIRYRILQHFHTNSEEYSIIFTANATAALKLIGESFDYENNTQEAGTFVYLEDNHTSVLGMRSYAENIKPLKVEDAFQTLCSTKNTKKCSDDTNSLFIYPAQSNFSGTKYPLRWIKEVQGGKLNCSTENNSKNWFVALDAASFVSTNDLDLSKYKPDFVTVSFYKIFGYPTGIGALLVKNTSQHTLNKNYYGGGTVAMALASENISVLRTSLSERYEDGTVPYLGILALGHGLDTFSRLGLTMETISEHTFNLAKYLYKNLVSMHHSNGKPVATLYHDTIFNNIAHQGAVINFNLLRDTGKYIGYTEVMHMANLHKIHLRTGCSCNPGACQRHLRLTSDDVKRHFKAGHVCGDMNDLVNGYPTGSVRISLGYMSRKKDVDAVLDMIKDCFVNTPLITKLPSNWKNLKTNYENMFLSETNQEMIVLHPSEELQNKQEIFVEKCLDVNANNALFYTSGKLKYIYIYPIKSCGAFELKSSWEISSSGLEYDRKWMIVDKSGSCMTQKICPQMCLVKPSIDIQKNLLTLQFPNEDSISLPLWDPARKTLQRCESKICRDKVIGFDCGDAVSQWLNKCLGCQGLRLIQQMDQKVIRVNKQGENLDLSFANKSQYLMLNLASVRWLRDRLQETNKNYSECYESILLRFRPNFVVEFHEGFVENRLETVSIGSSNFMKVGNCTRCQMICVNQLNGQKTKEPLITLARELEGKLQFGIYLSNVGYDGSTRTIAVGEEVVTTRKEIYI